MKLFGQLTNLVGLGKKEASAEDEERERLLALAIELTDRRIAKVGSFQETLWPAIQFARIYFAEVLRSIPGPFALDDQRLPLDVFFPNPDDLTACLGRSIDVKNELPHHINRQRQRVFALLGMRLRTGQDGKMQLADHTIRSLRRTPESVRSALLKVAFESLLQGFANQNLHHEKKQEQLRSQQEMLKKSVGAHSRLPTETDDLEPDLPKSAIDPKILLYELVEDLHNPAARLRLEYDNAHIVTGKELRLPLLITQDRRQWLIGIVEFPVSMAQKALEKETHNHRFILI
ncbi:MAG: hypothetical protein FWH15_01890 [Betaproteobacteria bacterium]|nr:hypothetical protein [Betaproteobacteria bacterium]